MGRVSSFYGCSGSFFPEDRGQDDTLLYLGHDYAGRTVTTVGEERRYNPRLGGERSEEDFVGLMAHLALPHPKHIDVAVAANLRMGKPVAPSAAGVVSGWAPAVRTYAGVRMIAWRTAVLSTVVD